MCNCKYYRVENLNIGDVGMCAIGKLYTNTIDYKCKYRELEDVKVKLSQKELKVIKDMIDSKCYSFDIETQLKIKNKVNIKIIK